MSSHGRRKNPLSGRLVDYLSKKSAKQRLSYKGMWLHPYTLFSVLYNCNVLLNLQMPLYCKSEKNGTFRISFAKLYILLSVGGSTNLRSEVIWGGMETINVKFGNLSNLQ